MRRIYAIPGLGTTKELFRELKIADAEIIVLDWPIPNGKETLKSYAERFLPQIDVSKPFYLMGVSFGGMICSELSEVMNPKKTFLISSAKCNKELPLSLRFFRYLPLHLLLPEKCIRFINGNLRHVIGFSKTYLPEFIAMMNSMPHNYYKYCIHYIVNWNREVPCKNSIHIHGNGDRLLKFKFVKPDYTIEGGTHAMVVNNATEISAIIEKHLY